MGFGFSREVGEGGARVHYPCCEQLCDAYLKGFRCGHWTIVKKENVIFLLLVQDLGCILSIILQSDSDFRPLRGK